MHCSMETVTKIEKRPLTALLDMGTPSTIVLRDDAGKRSAKSYKSSARTEWHTFRGNFSPNRKALSNFKFPELSTAKDINWICHVDHITNPPNALYDTLIGMDLMTQISIYVNIASKLTKWEGTTTPLKEKGDLYDKTTVELLYSVL